MEEKDLSVLSLRELIQMLKAIIFNQNEDVLRGSGGVEKKLEAQVEAKMQEEKSEEEKTKLQPVTLPKSSKAKRSDSLNPKEAATEKKVEEELAATKKQLKLQPFSAEKRFEEVAGNNLKEETTPKAFEVLGAAKIVPSTPRDIQQVNVATKESNKEMKQGWDVERIRAQRWKYDKPRREWVKAEDDDGKEDQKETCSAYIRS